MRNKRVKGYWKKRRETFADSARARTRAGNLRLVEHVSHVTVSRDGADWIVGYSVAGWYLEALAKAGLTL